ncbi:MAG: hypothetical protein LBG81_00715 [Coriobacteriaceae bacterium]|nr:hypothetical protein [Coriobacteriaceae bacterium]
MRKGRAWVVLGAVLLVALAATPFAISRFEIRAKTERFVQDLVVQLRYEEQNRAFWDTTEGEYLPYQQARENVLQIHLNAYAYNTGIIVKRQDIEAFLATGMNADGTPRIWKDDESGIVGGFVRWYGTHTMEVSIYRAKLSDVFGHYIKESPDCPYNKIEDLSAEQIMQLDAKLKDPAYDLDLAVAR